MPKPTTDPHPILPPLNDHRDRSTPSYLEYERRIADDIKERGQRHPITVILEGNALRVLAGETRRRACIIAGVDVWIEQVESMSRIDQMKETLLENEMRSDLKPAERAASLQEMLNEPGMNQQKLAKLLRVSTAKISKDLSLAGLLPEYQEMVNAGTLAYSVATQIARLKKDLTKQKQIGDHIIQQKLDRNQAAWHVNEALGNKVKEKPIEVPLKDGGRLFIPSQWDWPMLLNLSEIIKVAVKKGEGNGLVMRDTVANLLKSS